MTYPTIKPEQLSSLVGKHTSRRQALKAIGGLVGLVAASQFGIGCGSDDDPTSPIQNPPRDPMVLLVPGFLAQLYEAISIAGASTINDTMKYYANQVPLFGNLIANALPTLVLPVPPGGLISFDSLKDYFDNEGIEFVEMSLSAGFNTQHGVVENGVAIANYLKGLSNKRVTILSHSKGGLDTLEALLKNRDLWNTTVTGWVPLQAPFRGSPLADNFPAQLAGPIQQVFGVEPQSIRDLQTNVRQQYMIDNAQTITELTGAIPVTTCYSTFPTSPAQSFQAVATNLANAVFNSNLLADLAEIWFYNWNDPVLAVNYALEAIALQVDQLFYDIMRDIPMMGLTNLAMLEFNDGLVPISSAALAGATTFQMGPQGEGDHASPVMDVTPFKNFWTAGYRNTVTSDLVEELQGKAASII